MDVDSRALALCVYLQRTRLFTTTPARPFAFAGRLTYMLLMTYFNHSFFTTHRSYLTYINYQVSYTTM